MSFNITRHGCSRLYPGLCPRDVQTQRHYIRPVHSDEITLVLLGEKQRVGSKATRPLCC